MHFTVLVIGDDYEGTLSRYNENNPETEYDTKEGIIKRLREEKCSDETDEEIWEEYTDYYGDNVDEDGLYPYPIVTPFWDWYEVGGRWSGLIKLKPGSKPIINCHPHYSESDLDCFERIMDGRCDSAYLKDIDNLDEVLEMSYSILTEDRYLEDPSMEEKKEMLENLPGDIEITIVDCHS